MSIDANVSLWWESLLIHLERNQNPDAKRVSERMKTLPAGERDALLSEISRMMKAM